MSITKSSILLFVPIIAMALTGCASSQAVEQSESDKDTYSERVRSAGIAGAAVESVGWQDTISGEEAEDQPFSYTEQLLRGQIAGVEVITYPGGGISVRIRGMNSITGSSEPLYVVDGMPVLQRSREGLRWLNTQDIAKIQVIKDIDARALYGARGANGVVIITTKLGEAEQ